MRNLLLVLAGLVVILGIVSGNLWRELRAERQLNAEMSVHTPQVNTSDPGSAQVRAPQPAIEAKTIPVVAVEIPAPKPVSRAVEPAAAPALTPEDRIATTAVLDTLRAQARGQAEQTATARVLAWKDRLTVAGQTLTTPQLQALNAAAITELKREAEESIAAGTTSTTGPVTAETVARLREESIDRQNETNLRILKTASSELTAEQIGALRTLFEAGDAARRASARADRERNASQQ